MKTFTIIGGVNGAGKSSLTGVLKGQLKDLGIIIDVYKLAAAKAGGDNLKGGRIAVRRIQDCLDKGICFTQETTLNGFTTAKRASAAGYYIRLFYVGLDSLEESLQRIENRVAHGGHDIPTDTVRRRFFLPLERCGGRAALLRRGGVLRQLQRLCRGSRVPQRGTSAERGLSPSLGAGAASIPGGAIETSASDGLSVSDRQDGKEEKP